MKEYETLLNIGKERRTAKNYNKEMNVDQKTMEKIFAFSQTAPHSLGLEWVRVISFDRNSKHKENISNHMTKFNIEKAMKASNIAVLVTKKEEFFKKENKEIYYARKRVVKNAIEFKGGKFIDNPDMLIDTVLNGDWGKNGNNREEWIARQAYIQLGYILLGAKSLGVETTAVEGFEDSMNEYLLENKLIKSDERSTVFILFGYTDKVKSAYIGDKQLRRDIKEYITYE